MTAQGGLKFAPSKTDTGHAVSFPDGPTHFYDPAHEPEFELSLFVDLGTLPEEHKAIIGDAVHNLRVSLDALATELAAANNENSKNVYFPFADSAEGLERQIKDKNFRRCGPQAVALLKTLAPYRGGNLELRAIHDLDIADKHNGMVEDPEIVTSGFQIDRRLNDGREEWVFQASPKLVQFHFKEETSLGGREVVETLKQLVEVCEGVLEAFIPLHPAYEAGGKGPNGIAGKLDV
jgi:hypothetical protein